MGFIQLVVSTVNVINRTREHMSIGRRLKKYLFLLCSIILLQLSLNSAFAIEPQQKQLVKKLVDAVKANDRMTLSRLVSYPLFRQAPLAPINNQQEFIERFDEVFDRHLWVTITSSNINTDWDSIGWKGVILGNGIIALDPEGKITEINHHSEKEKQLVSQLALSKKAKGRSAVHRSISNYNQALVELTTERFKIRVDDVGQGMLRYTSWPKNRSMSEKPDLVLSNGKLIQSNGRNQRFVFNNGSYSYQLSINQSATNSQTSGSLEVFKGGQSWIREVATKVISR